MVTLSGRNTRTLTGYVVTMLDYPRWLIEREVDFTDCHLDGRFDASDEQCASCRFGAACCWLNKNRMQPSADTSLKDLVPALDAAVSYLRSAGKRDDSHTHARGCECDGCLWLGEATAFLRTYRHHR
jgi:hypothetical protein